MSLCISATMTASHAMAAQWMRVSDVPNGVLSIDGESERLENGHFIVWAKIDYSRPTASGAVQDKSQYDFDCSHRSWRVRYHLISNGAGELISANNYGNGIGTPEPLIPDSIADGIYKETCGDPFLTALMPPPKAIRRKRRR